MFMLTPSKHIPDCYTMALTDAASSGSQTQLMINLWESASVLDPWETVLPKAKSVLKNFGQEISDSEAEENIKHFYQTMRHGLSFDWVLNYVCYKILAVYPYSKVFKFGGTENFVSSFKDDQVFQKELLEIDLELSKIFDWVFESYPDRMVYARLKNINGSSVEADLYALSVDKNLGDGLPYVIPTTTAYRVNYLHLLLEMLSYGVGLVKRTQWHQMFDEIKTGVRPSDVIVVGGKFEAFAFGNLDKTEAKWHRFEQGIRMYGFSDRQQRSDYLRAFADTMTFFRFTDDNIFVDETLFPQVSFDDGETWLTANSFKDNLSSNIVVDKPLKMRVKYPFAPMYDDIGQKVLKIKGSLNCVVKDATITLDENNEGATQILFKAAKASFKISDAAKQYPFNFFSTDSVSISSLEWLD